MARDKYDPSIEALANELGASLAPNDLRFAKRVPQEAKRTRSGPSRSIAGGKEEPAKEEPASKPLRKTTRKKKDQPAQVPAQAPAIPESLPALEPIVDQTPPTSKPNGNGNGRQKPIRVARSFADLAQPLEPMPETALAVTEPVSKPGKSAEQRTLKREKKQQERLKREKLALVRAQAFEAGAIDFVGDFDRMQAVLEEAKKHLAQRLKDYGVEQATSLPVKEQVAIVSVLSDDESLRGGEQHQLTQEEIEGLIKDTDAYRKFLALTPSAEKVREAFLAGLNLGGEVAEAASLAEANDVSVKDLVDRQKKCPLVSYKEIAKALNMANAMDIIIKLNTLRQQGKQATIEDVAAGRAKPDNAPSVIKDIEEPARETKEQAAERYAESNKQYLSLFFDQAKLDALEPLDLQDAALTIKRALKVLRPDVVFALASGPNSQVEFKRLLKERDPSNRVRPLTSKSDKESGQYVLGINPEEYLELGRSVRARNIVELEEGYKDLTAKLGNTNDDAEKQALSLQIDKKIKEIWTVVLRASYGIFVKSKHTLNPDVLAAALSSPNLFLELQKKLEQVKLSAVESRAVLRNREIELAKELQSLRLVAEASERQPAEAIKAAARIIAIGLEREQLAGANPGMIARAKDIQAEGKKLKTRADKAAAEIEARADQAKIAAEVLESQLAGVEVGIRNAADVAVLERAQERLNQTKAKEEAARGDLSQVKIDESDLGSEFERLSELIEARKKELADREGEKWKDALFEELAKDLPGIRARARLPRDLDELQRTKARLDEWEATAKKILGVNDLSNLPEGKYSSIDEYRRVREALDYNVGISTGKIKPGDTETRDTSEESKETQARKMAEEDWAEAERELISADFMAEDLEELRGTKRFQRKREEFIKQKTEDYKKEL